MPHLLQTLLLSFVLLAASGGRATAQPGFAHSAWDALLKKHVSAKGVVDYRGFIRDSVALNGYLGQLAASPPREKWSRDEQMAWWLNAYNAYTVQLIARHYPLKSINDIKQAGARSPWDIPFIALDGTRFTLNHIEHEILRKQFADPRVHFAIVCASQSCPKLAAEAFEAGKLNGQLDRLTREFLDDPSRNKITARQAEVSQIFDWFKEDFTKKGTVPGFINQYATAKIAKGTKVGFLAYDWGLNDK
ncbi:MAG: Uncharacterized protein DUF547 [uncultured Cytophagales bacterium]|uniref:Uncharacterized protein DUF547 n=1 Tax=uncultured Cytophagales bacterium TaxID=158755 RepID=A0A6J4I4Q5_9SPHI|nr:MAG: Uncharacterized protein DUF547 [uncultured Cytophagales bacterium]